MSAIEIEYSKKLVSDFLAPLGLADKYTSYFVSSGVTEAEDIMAITDEDLRHIGITADGDIKAILQAACKFNGDWLKQSELRSWLREGDLIVHLKDFLQHGVTSLEEAAALDPTEDTLDELEVFLYGHRQRFQRRLRDLKSKIKGREEPLRLVHQGFWTTPSTMEDANSRFLCIKAIVKSLPEEDSAAGHRQTDPLLFLVDTGSECSALTRDVIQKLQLPRKGETTVVGVNSRTTADVYTCILEIGGQDIRVNVVEAETNAVGIATVSKFCHFISPTEHDWLHH